MALYDSGETQLGDSYDMKVIQITTYIQIIEPLSLNIKSDLFYLPDTLTWTREIRRKKHFIMHFTQAYMHILGTDIMPHKSSTKPVDVYFRT